MRTIATAFMLMAGWFALSAQIEWLETEYAFGTIKEADGPADGFVRFVNKGDSATFISRVRPSCGCTGATYPHRMIAPGDTATISFTYNPKGRPGGFDKTVKVYVGDDKQLTTIRIYGVVLGEESTLETRYPILTGDMRLESSTVPFGEMEKGTRKHAFLNIYNAGRTSLFPYWTTKEKAIEADVAPKEIKPGETGVISFYLDSEKVKPGVHEWILKLYPVKGSKECADITLRANVKSNSMVFIKQTQKQ